MNPTIFNFKIIIMSSMKQRVVTHAPKGARLLLQESTNSNVYSNGKSYKQFHYVDLNTGYHYDMTINELLKFVTIGGNSFKKTYTGYVSSLPVYLGVRSITPAKQEVYPMSAYNDFRGHSTDETTVYQSGLRNGAKPYYASLDCTVRYVLSDEEKSLLGL
jgi:hypothetical protein